MKVQPAPEQSTPPKPLTQEDCEQVWCDADAVCFDVDSTVTTDEGIDKLALRAGAGEKVAAVTRQAMGGQMPFGEALQLRLEVMNLQSSLVKSVAEEGPSLTPGVQELVQRLHALNKKVFLVSGGFRVMIKPVAQLLGIPPSHIFANTLFYDENGDYVAFNKEEPTSEAGGKSKAVRKIMREFGVHKVVMVGDGATDMEAKPPAVLTVGFGGNVVRDRVKQLADMYVLDFRELIDLLPAAKPLIA